MKNTYSTMQSINSMFYSRFLVMLELIQYGERADLKSLLTSLSNLPILTIDFISSLVNCSFISIVSILFSGSLIFPVATCRHLRRLHVLPALVIIVSEPTTTVLYCYKSTKHETLKHQVSGSQDQRSHSD